MIRFVPAALALPVALLACGGAGSPEEQQAQFREAGLYEITTRVGDLSGLGLGADDAAAMKRLLGEGRSSRQCLGEEPIAVGAPFLGGRCRYTRVADIGTRADRGVVCAPRGGSVESFEITGVTRLDGYRLRILSRRSDAATGRLQGEAETFEEARRLGPCPE